MPAENLTFSCPHCQTRLTVRMDLAGVTGPCPNCRGTVTAPSAAEDRVARDEVTPAPLPEPAPPPAGPPADAAEVAAEVPEESSGEPSPASSPRIRPEPRSLPERPQIIPLPVRRSTTDPQLKHGGGPVIHESAPRRYRLANALLPAAFLTLAATIVGTLVYFYAPGSPGQRLKQAGKPLVVQYPPKGTPPTPRPALPPPPRPQPVTETVPDPAPADAPGPRASGSSAAIAANEMLESFLRAKDAASRTAHVEPSATEAELAATLLGRELPEVARIEPDLPLDHPEEQMTEFPYRIAFYSEDSPAPEFGILVRKRGSQPPRVFLPAFLDLVGGRLAAFTAQPNSSPPARFHVYLEPIDDCFETEVPGHERKFTFKLMAGPTGKETARAYAANASRLRQLVENPDYPIRWGMRRRAMVTVQWNHKEDPARPYLELLEINAPDWNP